MPYSGRQLLAPHLQFMRGCLIRRFPRWLTRLVRFDEFHDLAGQHLVIWDEHGASGAMD